MIEENEVVEEVVEDFNKITHKNPMMSLGDVFDFDELRAFDKRIQEALGNIVHVSRSAIAKWENGNGIPSDVNLDSICKFLT